MLKGNGLLALAFIVLLVQRLWKQFPDGINFTFDLLSSFLAKSTERLQLWLYLLTRLMTNLYYRVDHIVSPIYKHTCSYL